MQIRNTSGDYKAAFSNADPHDLLYRSGSRIQKSSISVQIRIQIRIRMDIFWILDPHNNRCRSATVVVPIKQLLVMQILITYCTDLDPGSENFPYQSGSKSRSKVKRQEFQKNKENFSFQINF